MAKDGTKLLCSKCGSQLDAELRCWSATCGYRSPPSGPVTAGRYRHPLDADGKPCECNRGHLTLATGIVFPKEGQFGDYRVS